nr:MAG TPA: hypothetical protein [Caudoviricetes sp.]
MNAQIKPEMFYTLPYFESSTKRIIATNAPIKLGRGVKEINPYTNYKYAYLVTLKAFETLSTTHQLIYKEF